MTNYQHTERRLQTQKSKQDEKAENTLQVKEHDKCPPNQTEEEEIGSLPEKIQNNDSKNYPKLWKQNGITNKYPGDKD